MQPHIAKTIEDIELKIGFLTRLADALRSFESPIAVGVPIATATNGHTPPQKREKRKPLMRACRPRKGNEETLRITNIVETLTQPFDTAAIATAAKIDTKKASNFITQTLKKGWITRMGHGEYQRTKIYPGKSSGEKMLADIHKEIAANKPKDE